MERSTYRVLVVDDYEPWRSFATRTLQKKPELQVVGEASDGSEAVQKAQQLQPDLILLDIGLPTLNGIAAARRIRKLSPESRIVFVSQESSAEMVQEAFALGALGYVVKAHAGRELLDAVEAVCQGRQFVSSGLPGHHFTVASDPQVPRFLTQAASATAGTEKWEIVRNHEVQFYSDDASFLVSLTRFVESALETGCTVIVVATESHWTGLRQRLQTRGVDLVAVDKQERLVFLDAAEVLSTFMEDAGPSRDRFLPAMSPLIRWAENRHKRVVLFGEMVALLCAEGRMKAAIELEQLWNELAQTHSFHLRCAYPMTQALKGKSYAAICAEHSAVLSAEA